MNETVMANNPADKLCPIIMAGWASAGAMLIENCVSCRGPRCAWYDQTAERCAVLSMARNK